MAFGLVEKVLGGCGSPGSTPHLSFAVTSVLWQLLHYGSEIDPHVLAFDVAGVSKLDDMEQSEFQVPMAALKSEGLTLRRATPDGLVDHEVACQRQLGGHASVLLERAYRLANDKFEFLASSSGRHFVPTTIE